MKHFEMSYRTKHSYRIDVGGMLFSAAKSYGVLVTTLQALYVDSVVLDFARGEVKIIRDTDRTTIGLTLVVSVAKER